ncbi:MAG: peptidoglycan D,D-transpeptidase FtsI family protein [Actinomycetes bacterium]
MRDPWFGRLVRATGAATAAAGAEAVARMEDRLRRPPTRDRRRTKAEVARSTSRRLVAITVIVVLFFAAAIVKMGLLQTTERGRYLAWAVGERERSTELAADRGTIFDRNGRDLAISVPSRTIVVDPTLVEDKVGAAAKLARALDLPQRDVLRILRTRNRRQLVASGVGEARIGKLRRLGIPVLADADPGEVVVDPTRILDPAAAARRMAPVLGMTPARIRGLLETQVRFAYLARQVDEATVRRVQRLDPDAVEAGSLYVLGGVYMVDEPKRVATSGGDLAAPVIGGVNREGVALSGLEAGNDDILRGEPGRIVSQFDAQGREIPKSRRAFVAARRGQDLVLTLDQDLQYVVEQRLLAQVTSTGATGGTAVIADVRTGDVLAIASVVGADAAKGKPARPAKSYEQNRPLTWTYEPGSVSKMIPFAGAIERGRITADQVLTGVGSSIPIPGSDNLLVDVHSHPSTMTATEILAVSSNVGTHMVAEMLGRSDLSYFMHAFGYGVTTAIAFPGQSPGILAPVNQWTESDMFTKPIGMGVSVTPMQVLNAYMTIANGGRIVHPRLVAARIDADGNQIPAPRTRGDRVVTAETARTVTDMLAHVVAPSPATGGTAAIAGYTVAGKTGTARQVTGAGKDAYALAKLEATFVGFAPAEAPRLAAIVVLDGPVGEDQGFCGGCTSGPLFSQIMGYALRSLGVAPTRDPQGPSQAVTGPLVTPRPAAPAGPGLVGTPLAGSVSGAAAAAPARSALPGAPPTR